MYTKRKAKAGAKLSLQKTEVKFQKLCIYLIYLSLSVYHIQSLKLKQDSDSDSNRHFTSSHTFA